MLRITLIGIVFTGGISSLDLSFEGSHKPLFYRGLFYNAQFYGYLFYKEIFYRDLFYKDVSSRRVLFHKDEFYGDLFYNGSHKPFFMQRCMLKQLHTLGI